MSVGIDEVRHIAALARLRLSPDEIDRLTTEMNAILGHFEELRAAAGADAERSLELSDGAAPPRADGGEPDPLHIPPAAFAASWTEGFFTVPRLAAMEGIDEEEGV